VIEVYRVQRQPGELFIDLVRRIGLPAFKTAADAQRDRTAAR
jgi:hypothetical protein